MRDRLFKPVTDEQVFYDKFSYDKFYSPSARVYMQHILDDKFSYDKFYFTGVNVSTSLLSQFISSQHVSQGRGEVCITVNPLNPLLGVCITVNALIPFFTIIFPLTYFTYKCIKSFPHS